MTWLRGALARVGSRDAISVPVFLVTFMAGVIGNLASNTTAIPLTTRAGLLCAGQLIGWLPLIVVRFTVMRRPGRSRPTVVILSMVSGVVLRALFLSILFAVFVSPAEAKFEQRLLGLFTNNGMVFLVSAYVVSITREHRRRIRELERTQDELTNAAREAASIVAERSRQTLEKVTAILTAELEAVDPADAASSVELLQSTASDVVRPLSHDLASHMPVRTPAEQAEAHMAPVRAILGDAASGRPFVPAFIAVCMALEYVGALVTNPAGWAVYAASAALVFPMYAGANRILGALLPARALGVRVALLSVAALSSSAVLGAMAYLLLPHAPNRVGISIGVVLLSLVFSLGSAVAKAVSRDQLRVMGELEVSTLLLRRGVVRWHQAQWFQQRSLARALHGPVQSAVTAAALRLGVRLREEGQVPPGEIEQVRTEILAALEHLDEPSTASSLDSVFEQLEGTWSGLCEVDCVADTPASDVLAADAALRALVVDMIIEAVSNAVRHGRARSVRVRVLSESGDVFLRITSDGEEAAKPGSAGLGTRLLEECTLSWSRSSIDGSQVLEALVPSQ